MCLKAGEKVLIPAYHCNSMVEPVVHMQGTPVFYRVDSNATVDIEDVERRLDPKVRVLMVTNYFGFPQNLREIRRFCDERSLILIEDCAHVFFGDYCGKPIGSYGDYTFASPMKFFPIYDGGYLISAKRSITDIELQSAGLLFEAKGAWTIVGRGVDYRRFRLGRCFLRLPYAVRRLTKRLFKRGEGESAALRPGHAQPIYRFGGYFSGREGEYDPAWIHVRMSLVSRLVVGITAKSRVADRRRRNYQILLERLAGLPKCRPLFPILPDTVVPYVFPLVVGDPHEVFPALKRARVPISRFGEYPWRDFRGAEFPEAAGLSREVFQFPCHQEIRPRELDWMIATIRRVLGNCESIT